MKKRTLAAAAASILLVACASEPQVMSDTSLITSDGLNPVQGLGTDEAFVALDADLQAFKQFYIEPLDATETQVDYRPDSSRLPRGDWELNERDRLLFAKYYLVAMSHALQAEGYTLVGEPAEGVLVVKSQLLEIAPSAPKDDFKSRDPSVDYVSQGAGSLTLAMQLHDGADDRLLARVEDTREAGYRWQKNTRFNNQTEVRRVFSSWSRQFANRMTQLSGE